MKLTIKGITASTIMFNSLKLVLRGDSRYPDLYKESIARHIDVVNEDQLSEVNSLVNAGLILIENEDEIKKAVVISTPTSTNGVLYDAFVKSVKSDIAPKSIEIDKNSSAINNEDGDIEDAPSKPLAETKETKEAEETEDDSSKGRGRPKGSKNRKTIEKEQESSVVTPKKIVKRSGVNTEPKETDDIESRVVIMTPSGAKGGNMVKNASGDIEESEMTKASLEAMANIDAEEAADRESDNPSAFLNSDLDMSEQTGLSAVVSSDGNATKVKMETSILPEAIQVKERAVKFIDDEVDIDELEAFVDNENNIDNREDGDTDGEDDTFLEI